jgi:ribonuclease HI
VVDLPDNVFTIDVKPSWELYFVGASHTETYPNGTETRRGVGLAFKTSQGETIYHFFSLIKEECLNNEAEYEALIFTLLLALFMDIRKLLAYGDSQLIVRQINGIYK